MKMLIFDNRISKKYHKQEKIQIKYKFKHLHLMIFLHFLREFSFKTPMKLRFNKILNFQKYNYQTNKEADNQQRLKHLALKVVLYKCKNRIKKKFSRVGIRKKL